MYCVYMQLKFLGVVVIFFMSQKEHAASGSHSTTRCRGARSLDERQGWFFVCMDIYLYTYIMCVCVCVNIYKNIYVCVRKIVYLYISQCVAYLYTYAYSGRL